MTELTFTEQGKMSWSFLPNVVQFRSQSTKQYTTRVATKDLTDFRCLYGERQWKLCQQSAGDTTQNVFEF